MTKQRTDTLTKTARLGNILSPGNVVGFSWSSQAGAGCKGTLALGAYNESTIVGQLDKRVFVGLQLWAQVQNLDSPITLGYL